MSLSLCRCKDQIMRRSLSVKNVKVRNFQPHDFLGFHQDEQLIDLSDLTATSGMLCAHVREFRDVCA